ncbi:DUF4157 domain-containing protein [Mucilaginibacter sp. HMF5004]|uniref:eCIS core domain-containing protein n=1 Tax=Mucilaginibacter rivuli TaxID=2857527 RepID=UPI001C6074C0|nr:DUF4157 domain-containing protein [Mucilaginibacter rivuli]MBW4891617.1 DUF4157 domain-containing protein [Mucilaginibacter rivuli]
MQAAHTDKSRSVASKGSANNNTGAMGTSMPAVPAMQQKDIGPDKKQEYSLQPEVNSVPAQLVRFDLAAIPPVQKKANNTGLPDNLKSGIENLSGFSMDDTRVHYNSSKPAQLNAYAYAQGNNIHVAPGQEKHVAHEAWHVVQQKQGRVQATMQMKAGVAVNDDKGLENEADVMGAKALSTTTQLQNKFNAPVNSPVVTQLRLDTDLLSAKVRVAIAGETHHEIPEDEELAAWNRIGIKVNYEEETIPLNAGAPKLNETPDPPELRLSFAYAAMMDRVSPYLTEMAKPGKKAVEMGETAYVLNYLMPILRKALNDHSEEPAVEALKEVRAVIKGNKLALVQAEEVLRVSLAKKILRELATVEKAVTKIHATTGFRGIPLAEGPLRMARSKEMYERIVNVSGSLDKTIYKVGNDHAIDMRGVKPAAGVVVLEKAAYKTEYQLVSAVGPASAAAPKVSAAASSPAKPPASAPAPLKPGPMAAPVQSPAASSGASLPAPKGNVVPKAPLSPLGSAAPVLVLPAPASASGPVSLPARSPAALPSASVEKPKKRKKRAEPAAASAAAASSVAPAKSTADIKMERLLTIFNAAPEVVKKAKGYVAINGEIMSYYVNHNPEEVITNISKILTKRGSWGWGRDDATQKLYNDLAAEIKAV